MANLTEKHCVPCEGGEPPLEESEIKEYMEQVPEWELLAEDTPQIHRRLKFDNFDKAMEFVNKVAEIAQEQGHHPDISISYNVVDLTLYTHAIGGLHENDFVMAAKIDELT